MLDKLVGAQILKVSEDSIEVKLNDKVYTLEVVSDSGDCCGYADFKTNLLYSEGDFRNPIITNVEMKEEDSGWDSSSVLTFYGSSKPLASIESDAGSGSGWSYGAFVALQCRVLDINETLASW